MTAADSIRRRPPADLDDPYERLAFARAAMEESVDLECGPALPLPVVADVDADGVPCRLYATKPDAPLFVYVHGGGWCYGSIKTVDRVCRRIADKSGVSVLSVGYRLAPEHVFPAALDDVETVISYARKSDLGVDSTRLAIGGDSAGAQLATIAARRQRDAATPLDYQVLIYPALDPMTASESYAELGEYGLDRASMKLAWETYVPDRMTRFTPDVAIFATPDLAGMPPTLIITAEYDVLRDEGADYADALVAANVPVVHTRYMGVNHGFARKLAVIDAARAATDQVASSLRSALTF
ncbi:alpha/beta hydrolase [Actinoplanes sp. NPDC026619]|uniref:alpha/beta hydrolase n=1 Tax=Actinoplanes sp. NPDC026619 TaxID=3155798 RepID=UPI0033D2167B